MRLPNGHRPIIATAKIEDYCLNPNHRSGKNKARVFAAALGITLENSEKLRDLIKQAALKGHVVEQANTDFGQRLKVDWSVPSYDQVILRTIWE